MTTEKDDLRKDNEAQNSSVEKDQSKDAAPVKVPNPFEKNHAEISKETMDTIEQFKEAQTERD